MRKITLAVLAIIMFGAVFAASAWTADQMYHERDANTYPSMVNPGDRDVLVEVQLRNTYTRSYHNITGELIPSEPFTGVDTDAFVTRIDPNKTANIYYKVDVAEDALPGEYTLYHILDYEYYDLESTNTYTQYALGDIIHVTSKRTLTITIDYDQKVTIRDMHFEPERILPAEQSTLYVTVENTGSVTINNMDIAYEVQTDSANVNIAPLTVTKKSVDIILPGEEATVDFLMKSIDTATVQPYRVGVTVSSESGALTTREDTTVLDVIGHPDIKLAGVQTDKETIYQGMPFSLSIQFENVGTGNAKSTRVNLVDGGVEGITVSYVGEIEVDDTGSAIFDLHDKVPGKKVITAVVTYEDAYGDIFTTQEEVQYVITEMKADYTMLILLFVVIVVVGVWYWRRKEKRKKIEKLVK